MRTAETHLFVNVCESSRGTSGNRRQSPECRWDSPLQLLSQNPSCRTMQTSGSTPSDAFSGPDDCCRRAVLKRTQPRGEHDGTLALRDKPKQQFAKIRSPVRNTHTRTRTPQGRTTSGTRAPLVALVGTPTACHVRAHSAWAEATRSLTHPRDTRSTQSSKAPFAVCTHSPRTMQNSSPQSQALR